MPCPPYNIEIPRPGDWVVLRRFLALIQRWIGFHHQHVYNEQPEESVNGANTSFSTEYVFIAGTLEVYWNGQALLNGVHFFEDSDRQGYYFGKPIRKGMLWHSYEKDLCQ